MSADRSPDGSWPAPAVRIDGKPVAGVRGWECEDGREVRGRVGLPPADAGRAVPGTPVEVTVGGEVFKGAVGEVELTDTPAGRVIAAEVDGPAVGLAAPFTRAGRDEARSAALGAVFQAAGLTPPTVPGQDDIHPTWAFLGCPGRTAAERVAALGRTIPLYRWDGSVGLSDPTRPVDIAALPADRWVFAAHHRGPEVHVRAITPDPADWGKVIAGEAGGGGKADRRRLVVAVPEAASPGEAGAFAAVVRSALRAGRPRVHGGCGLGRHAPGAWVNPAGGPGPWLVTARRRTWSPDLGWEVELSGGFDPAPLLAPVRVAPTRGVVVSRDAAASRIRVRLPAYGAELNLDLLARVAGSGRVDAALPGPGDPVFVQWADDDPAHGLLCGSPVRPGAVPEAEFRDAHAVTRTGGFGLVLGGDGKLDQTVSAWRFVVRETCDGTAKTFAFNEYRG